MRLLVYWGQNNICVMSPILESITRLLYKLIFLLFCVVGVIRPLFGSVLGLGYIGYIVPYKLTVMQ